MNQYGLKKVRSQVAGFSLALIVASMFAVGVAQAATFADVQPSAWFYPYVEDLASKGIIDTTKTNYEPGRDVNRGEMAKLVVTAFNLQLETPTAAPFKDVLLGEWWTPYIATAVKNGIVSGYKDDTGALTGYYGPADSLTREQAAKIVALAAPLTTDTQNGPHFPDVSSARWSYEYIETAYNWSVVDGYTDGKFGPADKILRGQVAKIVSNALNPVSRTATPPPITGGDLTVELNSGTPAGQDVPCDAQSLVYAKFNLGTKSKAAAVSAITLKRVGLGSKDDFSKVWFENTDGLRVTARQTIGSDDYVTLNFSPALTINANSSSVLALVAKMKAFNDLNANGIKDSGESCYTGRNNAFQIEKAASVVTDGGTVGGNFPIQGNTMKTADYSTASVTAVVGGSTATYQVGELAQEFAQWKLTNTNSTRDVIVKTLTIKNEGTGNIAEDLANLKVVVNGTTISTGVTTNGEYATFTLGNYVLAAGKTDTFYVRADVVGMDSVTTDTIQFTVRYPEDLNAVEANTGFGVNHDLDTVITTATGIVYNIQGGDTTFVKSSTAPSSQTKPKGATTVTFLDANLIVKQDFNTDAVKVFLYSSVDSGLAATLTAADLKNIKLYVDGNLVQTKSGDVADFTSGVADATLGATGSKYVLNFDSTVLFNAGTRSVKVVADIESNAVSGHVFRAEVMGATAFLSAKYVSNDKTIAPVAGTVTGGDVTIGASKLTITENSGYTSGQKFVAGAQNATVAKFTVKANDSDAVAVTRLQFDLLGTKAPATNTVSGADLTSASVYVDGLQKGSTKSFTTGTSGTVQFSDVNFTIPSNGQVTVELRVSMTNSAAGVLIVDLAQLDAKDSSSTDALINGLANTPAGYQLAANTVNSIDLAIIPTGALSIAANSSSASSAYLVANSVEQELGKLTLAAQDDDIKVTNLYLRTVNGAGAPTTIASRISSVALYGNSGMKIADGIVNGNYVYFDIGDSSTLVVPKNTNNYTVTVKAKFNSITQASQTGTEIKLAIDGAPSDCVSGTVSACDNGVTSDVGARAVSASNNSTLSAAKLTESGTAETNLMYLTKTAITLASVDAPGLEDQNKKLSDSTAFKAYAFSVTADANGDAELAQVSFAITDASGVITNYKIYEKDDASKVIFNGALVLGEAVFTSSQRIAAGTTKTYIVELVISGTVAGANSISIKLAPGLNDTSFTKNPGPGSVTWWSDLSDTAHSSTPAINLDWFTGFKIKGYDSMGPRSYSNF